MNERWSLARWWWLGPAVILLGGIWLAPIAGKVTISSESQGERTLWPQITLSPAQPGDDGVTTITVTDSRSWAHVRLTVDGQIATFVEAQQQLLLAAWRWVFTLPMAGPSGEQEVIFYSDCHTGCQERGRARVGQTSPPPESAVVPASLLPTKLCTAFPDPQRDWHGRRGWVVDLTYARLADDEEDPYWSVDALAGRVALAQRKGLRVLVRVEYDREQSLPPAGDHLALADYLAFARRLARDARLASVYGYIIGSGPNALDANAAAPEQPVSAEWYARLFNGYGEPVAHVDNVVQTIRQENQTVRILVGPVRPWVTDQGGTQRYAIDTPWLNYFYTLVSALDESTRAKAAAGIAQAGPDGFALNAPGRPHAAELGDICAAREPQTDLLRADWNNAQAGFRIYRNWLDIINAYPTTRGLPAYLSATNTFTADEGLPPAQNYPEGWLTTALAEVNAEPQIHALCWFLDLVPGDDRWDAFSLSRQQGRMIFAAEEFDRLLGE
jgi:hypothetical protein